MQDFCLLTKLRLKRKKASDEKEDSSSDSSDSSQSTSFLKKEERSACLNSISDEEILSLVKERLFTPALLETFRFECDKKGNLLEINNDFLTRLDFSREEILGKPIYETFLGRNETEGKELLSKIFKYGELYTENVAPCRKKSLESCYVSWTNRLNRNKRNTAQTLLAVGIEITNKKRLEKTLSKFLTEDKVLPVLNKDVFLEKSALEIEKAHFLKVPLTLMTIELGYFYDVSKTKNPDFSDEILANVALILQKKCQKFNLITRLHDTVFAILFLGLNMEKTLEKAKEIKNELIKQSFKNKFNESFITPSFNVVEAENSKETIDSLLQKANIKI